MFLCENQPDGRGVREFLEILKLHQEPPVKIVTQAIEMALELGAAHLDGVQLCLRRLLEPEPQAHSLDLSSHPQLVQVGNQPLDLGQYDRLLQAR